MRCQKAKRKISSFLDGALSSREAGSLQKHIESCAACQEELRSARALDSALGELPRIFAQDSALADRVRQRVRADKLRRRRYAWARVPRFVPATLVFAAGLMVGALVVWMTLLPSFPFISRLSKQTQKTVEVAFNATFEMGAYLEPSLDTTVKRGAEQ